MAYLFLSYAKADRDAAFAMHEALQYDGIVVWMDENLNTLEDWRWPRIEKIVQESGGFVLLVSDAAKQSAWVKRELDYAEKTQKPIFPILIQGEGWERLTMETAKLGLGLKLDLPDDFAAQMEKISKDVYDKPFPPQIPIENKAAQQRKFLIGLILIATLLIVVYRLALFFQETSANLDATATAVVIASRGDYANTQAARQTATREAYFNNGTLQANIHQANMSLTAAMGAGVLPCSATANMDDGGFMAFYHSTEPDASPSRTMIMQEDETLLVTEWIVNDGGVWYGTKLSPESLSTSYVHAEDLILAQDCPR